MSRFGEYQFGEWRFKRTEMYVTMDTIIPSMPKKLLEEPDDGKYHLQVAAIDDQIDQLNDEFRDMKAQRWEKRSAMVDGQQARNPVKDQLTELFRELRVYTDQKKEIHAKMEAINHKIQDQERNRAKEQKNVHPIYNEESKMSRGIKELEKRLHTTSLARAEE